MTRLFFINIAIAIAVLGFGVSAHGQDLYLVESEDFQFHGKWVKEKSHECSGGAMLRVYGGGSKSDQMDAITIVDIKQAGDYDVWTRVADQEQSSGKRRLCVIVDGQQMSESGLHGKTGFLWEKVGRVSLDRKQVLLRIHDVNCNFGRCDAVLLTNNLALNPNEETFAQNAKNRVKPVVINTLSSEGSSISAPLPLAVDAEVVAKIENPEIRFSFVKAGVNNKAIACRTEIKTDGYWRGFLGAVEDHKVFILTSDNSPVDNDAFYPGWKNTVSDRKFVFEGNEYTVPTAADFVNPYVAGALSEAIPIHAINSGRNCIEVQYITRNRTTLTGYWSLPAKGTHINVRFVCMPSQKGMYSIGIAAFQPVSDHCLSNILLPPMFQYKRVPKEPLMLLSSMMQQPVSIAESQTRQGMMSSFVCADLLTFPTDWGSYDYSPMGFAIKNESNQVQPVAFSPVLGMKDSRFEQGQSFERSFVVGVVPAAWSQTLEYVSDNVFKVTDYRKQVDVSLTNAMFNIVDLMRNKEYGGWDSSLKGFYDIEGDPKTAPTVVHSAPLAIIAAAVTADDQDFYLSHALPTIEYTLSRSGYRWAKDVVLSGYNRTLETLRLNPFRSQFTTTYYDGLDLMLGRLNPWLREIALPADSLRKVNGYSAPTIGWAQAMSAYRITGDSKWLSFATSTADRYITTSVYKNSSTLSGDMAFYNSNVYAVWWDLIDLYEITGNRKYLDAAQYGAAHTIAGIRSYPAVGDGVQTIHKDGRFEGNTTLWWKGKERYRLGFPRELGDAPEKQIEQWKVSAVGLGFEQPATYFIRTKGKQVRPVFMSNWAPHLLRLFSHTGKSIYQTYARNAVIGRFKNYPGYYATGYSDITMSESFPFKGPDVSSIYYHHLPPHLAFTWDYLITETIQRSAGKVSFPYSKQEGFVWFANRIYNSNPGKVFSDQKARIWMKKGLITADNPAVNYVTAVSDNFFWVLLCNESDKDELVNIALGNVPNIAVQSNAIVYTEKGQTSKTDAAQPKVTIPAKGFRAVCLPLLVSKERTIYPTLKEGMRVVELDESLGKMFLFRIRSPFGWDSVYGYIETPPVKGKKIAVEVVCNGESQSVLTYPFEWSFAKLGLTQDAEIKVSVSIDGAAPEVTEVKLKAN